MPMFFCLFFFPPPQNGKIAQWYPVVIGPSAPWQLTAIQWGVNMPITRVILRMIDVVMHGQGRVTWRTTRFLLLKLFGQSFCILTCLDYDHQEHYSANAQNTYRCIHKSYCSRPIHTKRCYWAVILERIESRTLESHESLECFVCQVCQCLSWKTYTCCKKQNLKSETKLHILYGYGYPYTLWIFIFNKYMIQNPVFLCIMLLC